MLEANIYHLIRYGNRLEYTVLNMVVYAYYMCIMVLNSATFREPSTV